MKLLLCIWWTARGRVHFELLNRGQTMTGELYSQQLEPVHRAMQTKEPALINRKGVVSLQDNARPHGWKVTQGTITRLQWETLYHPPYSADLSPSDWYWFLSLDNLNLEMKKRFKVPLTTSSLPKPKISIITAFSSCSQDGRKLPSFTGIIYLNKLVSE